MQQWHPDLESFCRALYSPYPLALPALFFATALEGLAEVPPAGVLPGGVVAVTGARALLAAALFPGALPAGFAVLGSETAFSVLAGLAFFATRFGLPPPLAARSSISAMASGSVIVSCVLSLGMVAL